MERTPRGSYTDEDVARLAERGRLHDTLSGAATRALAPRACRSMTMRTTHAWRRSRCRICTTSVQTNRNVGRLLEKLRIELTRSRPRQTNDNALAECKNGAVVRKAMGYGHIPQKHATTISRYHQDALNPYPLHTERHRARPSRPSTKTP